MTLGLSTCNATTLMADGPNGCSSNSFMGRGVASVEVPFGSDVVHEKAYVTAVMGPPVGETTVVLFYAEGTSPLAAAVVFSGVLESTTTKPFGIRLSVNVPLIASVPGGPDVSVTSFSSTIGPHGLRYRTWKRGKRTTYSPVGLSVPAVCGRRGFVFAGEFSFIDGSNTFAKSVVPCPARKRKKP